MEKEEQAKREAEEAQALTQQGDQWSSVAPPTEVGPEGGQWDSAGDVSAVDDSWCYLGGIDPCNVVHV